MQPVYSRFSHEIRSDDGVRIVTLRGAMCGDAAFGFRRTLIRSLAAGGERVVFDCGGLAYMGNHAAFVALVTARWLKERNGRLVMCNLAPALREVVRSCGVFREVPAFDSLEEAVAAVRGRVD